MFLATWKDIPNENELQYQIKECHLNAGKPHGHDHCSVLCERVIACISVLEKGSVMLCMQNNVDTLQKF